MSEYLISSSQSLMSSTYWQRQRHTYIYIYIYIYMPFEFSSNYLGYDLTLQIAFAQQKHNYIDICIITRCYPKQTWCLLHQLITLGYQVMLGVYNVQAMIRLHWPSLAAVCHGTGTGWSNTVLPSPSFMNRGKRILVSQ